MWFLGLPLNEQYVLTSAFGFPLHLQVDYCLLTPCHLVEYVSLYAAKYVFCDTDSTLALNMCDSL